MFTYFNMKKKDIKTETKDVFVPRTKFQELVKDLKIDETLTLKHKKQTKFNKFLNSTPLYENYNGMCDLLIVPETPQGYKYLLVYVDLGTNLLDFEPMKNKESKTTLKALQEIFKRKYVDTPKFSLNTDGGSEFKKEFHLYFENQGVHHKISMPYRHTQQGVVEGANAQISRVLLSYLNDRERETQKKQTDWTPILPQLRETLNRYRDRGDLKKLREKQTHFNPEEAGQPEYNKGDMVHYKLNRPYNALNQPLPDAKFRKGDIVWSPTTHKIEKIIVMGDEPYYRYVLNDIANTSFSADQLMLSQNKEKTYLVRKLLDKKIVKKVTYYLVWWKGYLKKDSTWEKESDLIEDGFEDDIKAFKKS